MKDDMLHLAYVSLGEHRGHRRLWLEGRRLEDAGFGPATRYAAILDAAAGRIRLVARPDGDRMVSQRQREGGVCRPIVDLANALLDRVLGDRRRARVAYAPGEIEITIHHLDRRAEARAAKLALVRESGVVRTGGICSGAGILDAAIHDGLADAGLDARPAYAVEIDPRYSDILLENNRSLGGVRSVVANLDEIEPETLPAIDCLVASLPCVAASLAGRAKKGAGVPERDPDAGHLIVPFLALVREAMPVAVIFENVLPYRHTASFHIAETTLQRLGYRLHETELWGTDFGAMEKRGRLCLVAVDPALPEDFLDDIVPRAMEATRTLADILDEEPPESEKWRDVSYLAAKEVRNLEDGHNFRRQLVDPSDREIGVIGRQYWKWRSTEPMVPHPTKPNFARLLTPAEHARVKGIDEAMVDGVVWTTAHEVLGQSIIPAAFRAVGAALGRAMGRVREATADPDALPLFAGLSKKAAAA